MTLAIVVPEAAREHEYFVRQIQVNGISLERLRSASCSESVRKETFSYTLINPYYLKNGKNEISMNYWVNLQDKVDESKTHSIRFWGTQADVLGIAKDRDDGAPEVKLGADLVDINTHEFSNISEDNKKTLSVTFNWSDKLPTRSWENGETITESAENKKSLYAEYLKIWNGLNGYNPQNKIYSKDKASQFASGLKKSTQGYLQASQMIFQNDGLDRMLGLAVELKDKKGTPLGLREVPDINELTMTIFAGGKLAKLNNYYATLLRFQGGGHDVPRGRSGPVDIGYDLWFRMNKDKNWELDAVVPANGLYSL